MAAVLNIFNEFCFIYIGLISSCHFVKVSIIFFGTASKNVNSVLANNGRRQAIKRIGYEGSAIIISKIVHQENISIKSIPSHTPLLYSKTGVYMSIPIFLIFDPKHRLWALVRTTLARRF